MHFFTVESKQWPIHNYITVDPIVPVVINVHNQFGSVIYNLMQWYLKVHHGIYPSPNLFVQNVGHPPISCWQISRVVLSSDT